jgi:hypothetical protein
MRIHSTAIIMMPSGLSLASFIAIPYRELCVYFKNKIMGIKTIYAHRFGQLCERNGAQISIFLFLTRERANDKGTQLNILQIL